MQNDLDKLISLISKLPGLGSRSAKRIALHLLKSKESLMIPLSDVMRQTAEKIKTCHECGNYDTNEICGICANEKRDGSVICVVEDVADLWAMERGNIFSGKYHILGGRLSAIDGVGPDKLTINKLLQKAAREDVKEIILATNATVEGQTTAHYISDRLKDIDVKITQLAYGIPIGGELDYLDEGTLLTAMRARKSFN